MLVYIVVFGMALNLMVSLLSTGSRLAATTTLGLGRMEGLREVMETFTNQTRKAVAVVDGAGAYQTGDDRLVLRMPEGTEDGFDYLVIGRLHEPNKFGVLGLKEGESGLENVYMSTLRQPLEVLRFEVDGAGFRPVVHLDVQIKLEEGERERPFILHRSSAMPRGMGS